MGAPPLGYVARLYAAAPPGRCAVCRRPAKTKVCRRLHCVRARNAAYQRDHRPAPERRHSRIVGRAPVEARPLWTRLSLDCGHAEERPRAEAAALGAIICRACHPRDGPRRRNSVR